jgi:hypothetical protein
MILELERKFFTYVKHFKLTVVVVTFRQLLQQKRASTCKHTTIKKQALPGFAPDTSNICTGGHRIRLKNRRSAFESRQGVMFFNENLAMLLCRDNCAFYNLNVMITILKYFRPFSAGKILIPKLQSIESKCLFFRLIFGENILKIIASVPVNIFNHFHSSVLCQIK